MADSRDPPDSAPPDYLDYEMWTGPAPMRPYNELVHPRSWRAFMEYGNGIVGDMCIHMLDAVRWMLDLGWPKSVSSNGGILIQKQSKSNISRHPDGNLRLRRLSSRLAAPHLWHSARSEVSVGR
jgi:predicted dehydrogenase